MKNTDFFQSTSFKENNNMAVQKISKSSQAFTKNNVFQLSHGIRNTRRSKFHQWHTYCRRTFGQLPFLKVCESFGFAQCQRTWSVLWSVRAFFLFIEKRVPNKYLLWEEKLISYMYVFSLLDQGVSLLSIIAV